MPNYTVADVMTRHVVMLPKETMIDEAAQAMRDARIGDVVVTDGPMLAGVVTDRDIVVRAVAEHHRPDHTTLGQIASRELVMIQQTATVAEAMQVMRERGLRRLLVCDADRQLVGILSLSDLALRPPASDTDAEPQ
jgi:CBS domain-containing protein